MTSALLYGLVLCGGESQRMGTDKGLVMHDGRPWFLLAGEKLKTLGFEVYYSIRSAQSGPYRQFIDPNRLIIDDHESAGPLSGLRSALNKLPGSDFFVLACDMFDIDISFLQLLQQAASQDSKHFFAYRDSEYFETFPAIYRAAGIFANADARSLQQLLRAGDTLALVSPGKDAFPNHNKPR